MQRSWPLAVMAALVIALGGCAAGVDPPSQEAPEGIPDAELASEQTSARAVGVPGWMAGDIVGLVTNVSHNTNGHFVTVGRDADGHAREALREDGP
jgi:hypothetical protein